ncbi:MAG: YbhB/YbcL family Raf kinase inhibitor-like protein [Tagaea sp.]|nr:YbhB/YbcL family Raf kinase inhibitor-like protein [Tagaea sp.]
MPRFHRDRIDPEIARAGARPLSNLAAAAALTALFAWLFALMERPNAEFELASPDIAAGVPWPDRLALSGYGCVGDNVSPALVWRGAPATTRGFAVTMLDPDSPDREIFWHWIVVGIPADRTFLPSAAPGAKPVDWPAEARELRTDFGVPGYGGPCPPEGALHRYVLTVYALSVAMPEVPPELTTATIGRWLRASAVAKAELTGFYSRP